jgi:hypothetical protein
VAVNDTIEKKLVALGPVTVTFGREPRMQQCPICRTPGEPAGSMPAIRASARPHEGHSQPND